MFINFCSGISRILLKMGKKRDYEGAKRSKLYQSWGRGKINVGGTLPLPLMSLL